MDVLEFLDGGEWETWLEKFHDQKNEAWLRIGKLHSTEARIKIDEAGGVALCFAWVDGQRKTCDEGSFLQRYSRRRAGSAWSKVNVDRVEALLMAGRMHPGGIQEIEAAKADGRWGGAYEPQRTAAVPEELTAALAASPTARAAFEGLGRSERYLLLLPLLKAHTPRGRAGALARIIVRLGL